MGWQTGPSYFLASEQLSKAGEVGGGQQQESLRCHHGSSCTRGGIHLSKAVCRPPAAQSQGEEGRGRRNQGRRQASGHTLRKTRRASEKKS